MIRLALKALFGSLVAGGIVSAQEAADKWANNSAAATTKYEQGVQNTQVDVVGRAIAQQGVLLSNFTQAVTSGRWARRLTASGGTANWKNKTVAKSANYGTGIAAAKDSFQAAMGKLLPYIAQGQATIHSMPKGSISAAKARASAWIDYMAAYKQQ